MNGGLRKTADSAHIISSGFKAVKVWLDLSGSGTVRQGSWGVAGSGSDRHVMVRQLRLVKTCFGMVSCVMAVKARLGMVWSGSVGYGRARHGTAVEVRFGEVRFGLVRRG